MISCKIRHAGPFWFALIILTGNILHGQRMDLLALFIGKQFYRQQVVRPALLLFSILHFRACQYQDDLFPFLNVGHIKSSNSVFKSTKKNSGLSVHLFTFPIFIIIIIILIGEHHNYKYSPCVHPKSLKGEHLKKKCSPLMMINKILSTG
ncbi:hypothetical protein C1N56_02490 [Pantoea sp. SGAir0175]